MSCYDISAAIMAVVVSYYGHHHKPKWLGIGAFILGIGCFLFALPHVLVGRYEPGSSITNLCSSDSFPTNLVCKSAIWYHIFVFVLAEFFIGVGATPVYILGTAFIDENVRRSTSGIFLGIMYAVATFGPAIGFLLGGEFLNIYVDIQQVSVICFQFMYLYEHFFGCSLSVACYVKWSAKFSVCVEMAKKLS